MACGMCGPTTTPAKLWHVEFPDGTTGDYLTRTEARMAATAAGGGNITSVAVAE